MAYELPKLMWISLDAEPGVAPEDQIAPEMVGVSFGCKRLTATEHDQWVLKQSRNEIAESKRKLELRKGHTADSAPEFFAANFQTPEALEARLKLANEMIAACVVQVKGTEEAIPDLCAALGLKSRVRLFAQLISGQVPRRAQSPVATGPSDV